MPYKITDLSALQAAFPQFIKMKSVKTVTEVPTLKQRDVRAAIKLGITVPGIEEVDAGQVKRL